MALDLLKVADVIDAAATYIDEQETEKVSSATAEKRLKIDELASKYAAATGEEVSETLRGKLAAADGDIVALFRSLTEKNAGVVDTLGSSADRDDGEPVVTNVKEASAAADERFLHWVTS